jgi:hypothetical protein
MLGSPYRQAKWEAKVKQARLLADLTALTPNMTARFAAVTPEICATELAVKQVLDVAGVPTITYPFYLDFGRSMWSYINRDFSGESLSVICAVHIAKWVARGLTQSVLQALRTQVYNIAAPVAP